MCSQTSEVSEPPLKRAKIEETHEETSKFKVQQVFDDPVLFRRNVELANEYIEKNSLIKWCPKHCNRAIHVTIKKSQPALICLCGYSFCFECDEEHHDMLTCTQFQQWKEIKESGSAYKYEAFAKTHREAPNYLRKDSSDYLKSAFVTYKFCYRVLENGYAFKQFYKAKDETQKLLFDNRIDLLQSITIKLLTKAFNTSLKNVEVGSIIALTAGAKKVSKELVEFAVESIENGSWIEGLELEMTEWDGEIAASLMFNDPE